MKNNKGFSLVELIIVIAIMAILVGVMAPQLIKYIEKANVSADTQVCDSVRTAVQTTIMDPAVVTDKAYTDVTATTAKTYTSLASLCNAANCTSFKMNIASLLNVGTTAQDATLQKQLKSYNAKTQNFSIYLGPNGSNIIVYLKNTDASGSKKTNATPSTNSANSCIYAGTLTGSETF